MILLTNQDEIGALIGVQVLAGFITELAAVSTSQLDSAHVKVPLEVVVQCELAPDSKGTYNIAIKPPESITESIKNLHTALEGVKTPAVKGNIKFLAVFTVMP